MAAARQKQLIRQRDFSTGEVVEHAKRRDDDARVRAGARQLSNWRVLAAGAVENRPGRVALFPDAGRCDEVAVTSETVYRLCFGDGTLKIRDADGLLVAGQAGFPWSSATVHLVTWAFVNRDVVVCFPNMKPLVARWNGTNGWSFQLFAFAVDGDGIPKVPFYRIAARGITMTPSAKTGSVTLTTSADVFVAGHVGAIFRWANKRLRIDSVASATSASATCLEDLLPVQRLTVTASTANGYALDQVVVGSVTETEGVVVDVDHANNYVYVQLLNYRSGFTTSDTLIGPYQRTAITATDSSGSPKATTVWDEQLVSDARGWPQSCSSDVSRLIFCDIPGVPEAILWMVQNEPDNGNVGTLATDAIVELMQHKPRVYHVVGGADEFVFTNKGVYYIPISEANPLRPGSVTFRPITSDCASTVRPISTPEGLIFVNAGGTRVIGIVGTGQAARPYVTRDVSDLNGHLFSSPIALAATTGDGQFPERYIFVCNSDGTVAVGRYNFAKDWTGWVPWSPGGGGNFRWVSALGGNALFVTEYAANTLPVYLVERMDANAWLDAQVPINDVPAPLQPGTENAFEIFPLAGDAIGNMTAAGGLAAIYDGDTSKTAAEGAMRGGTSGFYGRHLPVPLPLLKVEVWPSSDAGFSTTTGNITFELRGSNSAPNADGSNGTLLVQTVVADTTSGPVTITSADVDTAYSYLWVRLQDLGASNIYLAQAKFYRPGYTLEAPGGGVENLWMMAGRAPVLMNGLLPLGERDVDGDGLLVMQEGDVLTDNGIVAGFAWTATLEPFVPHANEGQSYGQTLQKRQLRGAVAVQKSTGFKIANLVVPYWRQGEDQSAAPPVREEVVEFSWQGADHDPRVALTKDTPGPLRVLELSMEVTV